METKALQEFNKLDSLIYLLAKTKLAILLGKPSPMPSNIVVKYLIYIEPKDPFVKTTLTQGKIEQWGWGNIEYVYPLTDDNKRDKEGFNQVIYRCAKEKINLMKQEFFNDLVIDPNSGIRVVYKVFVENERDPAVSVDMNTSNITYDQPARLQYNYYPDKS